MAWLNRNAYLSAMSTRKLTRRKSEFEDDAWNITRLTGTTAEYVGRVYAPDEPTAIARAIEEFQIPEAQWQKLAARRG